MISSLREPSTASRYDASNDARFAVACLSWIWYSASSMIASVSPPATRDPSSTRSSFNFHAASAPIFTSVPSMVPDAEMSLAPLPEQPIMPRAMNRIVVVLMIFLYKDAGRQSNILPGPAMSRGAGPSRYGGEGSRQRIPRCGNALLEEGEDLLLARLAGNDHFVFLRHVDVDLAPDAELSHEVNSRFDRESRLRNDGTFVAGLEVVHIRPAPMEILCDRVAGPVDEIFPVPALGDEVPRGIVDVAPSDGFLLRERFLQEVQRCVAGVPYDLKDLDVFFRDRAPQVPDPGNVVVGRTRFVLLGPQIQQNEIAGLNVGVKVFGRLVVGIAAIRVHGTVRRLHGHEAVFLKSPGHELLNVVLVERLLPFDLLTYK